MRKKFAFFLILASVMGLVPTNFSKAITQNQINAEVQIVCTDGAGNWFSGSGTIIDPKGIILTNRHVIEGAYKNTCIIGFIESINKEPNFYTSNNLNLAEVKYYTTTSDMDAAILYLENSSNKSYPYVNIWASDSDTFRFGDDIEVVGYPSIGGSTITYTSGDFSGFGSKTDGTQNYIKSTANLEHGNSGGASYNSNGQFIGIPSMVVVGSLNSLSYILSVNSIKSWLSATLGTQYQSQIVQQTPATTKPAANIQSDLTPPAQKKFYISFHAFDDNGKEIYFGSRYNNDTSAVYEFSNIKFSWGQNCSNEYCINDESGVKGYYYYFGNNINAIPKINGTYISGDQLIKDNFNERNEVILPTIFKTKSGEKNYFILQAEDNAGNLSNSLINFEYVSTEDSYKDIKSIDIYEENNLLGILNYPTAEQLNVPDVMRLAYINTNINSSKTTFTLCPNYGHKIEGLSYYLLFNSTNSQLWDDKYYRGIYTRNNCIKIASLDKYRQVTIFMQPSSNNLSGTFKGSNDILTIKYKSLVGKNLFISSSDPGNQIKFTKINSQLSNKILGRILLQTEKNGEAYYVYPNNKRRYYMANGDEAYRIMRYLGVGITNNNLNKIKSDKNVAKKNSGKIFLQVEANGEAYYIDFNGNVHYLKDGSAAYAIMRNLGLGISNVDLNKIPEGSL